MLILVVFLMVLFIFCLRIYFWSIQMIMRSSSFVRRIFASPTERSLSRWPLHAMRRFRSYWPRWHRLSTLPLEPRMQSSLLLFLLFPSLMQTLLLPFLLQKHRLIQLKSWTHLRHFYRFLWSLLLLLLRLRFITLAELDAVLHRLNPRFGGGWGQVRASKRKMNGSAIFRAVEMLLQELQF